MLSHRPWWLFLPVAVAVAGAPGAAHAQQPDQNAPASTNPPAPAKKPPKPKPPASPAATPAPAAATPAVQPPVIAGGAKAKLLGQYGDWGAYSATPGGKKVCFAIAKPASAETNPAGKTRKPSYMFISTRPADKVSNEVSIIIGYSFKANSDATLEVGPNAFALYTQQDGAWIKNTGDETHVIEVLRAGQSAVVKGVSAKGTKSTDTFSLKGLSQALDRSDQDCK